MIKKSNLPPSEREIEQKGERDELSDILKQITQVLSSVHFKYKCSIDRVEKKHEPKINPVLVLVNDNSKTVRTHGADKSMGVRYLNHKMS